MNILPPLPDAGFKPLTAEALEAMIQHAVSHPQHPAREKASPTSRLWVPAKVWGTGVAVAAIAGLASVVFLLTPFAPAADDTFAELSDMLILESMEAPSSPDIEAAI